MSEVMWARVECEYAREKDEKFRRDSKTVFIKPVFG